MEGQEQNLEVQSRGHCNKSDGITMVGTRPEVVETVRSKQLLNVF